MVNEDQLSDTAMALVGILNLQVVLAPDGDSWIAQAIEFDYAAAGDSPEDVKRRFQDGLVATIQEHFNIFGGPENLLETRPPADFWLDLVKSSGQKWRYTQVSLHEFVPAPHLFPFGKISYLIPEQA